MCRRAEDEERQYKLGKGGQAVRTRKENETRVAEYSARNRLNLVSLDSNYCPTSLHGVRVPFPDATGTKDHPSRSR